MIVFLSIRLCYIFWCFSCGAFRHVSNYMTANGYYIFVIYIYSLNLLERIREPDETFVIPTRASWSNHPIKCWIYDVNLPNLFGDRNLNPADTTRTEEVMKNTNECYYSTITCQWGADCVHQIRSNKKKQNITRIVCNQSLV